MSLVSHKRRLLAFASVVSALSGAHISLVQAQSAADKTLAQAILASQDVQQFNVMYHFDSVAFAETLPGGKVQNYVALASLKLGRDEGSNKLLHRIIVRRKIEGDTTAYLENSETIFDSGVQETTLSKAPLTTSAEKRSLLRSSFNLKSDPREIRVWLSPASLGHRFPLLRAAISDISTGKFQQCAQGVIDGPFKHNVQFGLLSTRESDGKTVCTEQCKDASSTPCRETEFPPGVTYAYINTRAFSEANNNFVLSKAGKVAGDDETLGQLCRGMGFDGVARINKLRLYSPKSSFDRMFSCRNMVVVRYVNGAWTNSTSCDVGRKYIEISPKADEPTIGESTDVTCYKLD
jgi:hypothetical protein